MGLSLKTRWFRFGLRGLLVTVTLLAVLLATLGVRVRRTVERQRLVDRITADGGSVFFGTEPVDPFAPTVGNWFDRLFGGISSRMPYVALEGGEFTDNRLAEIVTLAPEIEWLVLKNTNITDAGFETLPHLRNLSLLRIDGCPITGAALVPLGRCRELQLLELHKVSLTGRTIEHLASLSRLWELLLDDADIADEDLLILARLPLEGLTIRGQHRCTDEGLATIGGMRSLRTLEVDGAQFTDAGLRHLAPLDELQILQLRNTGVSDAGVAALAELKLSSLSIIESQLDGTGLGALAHMKTLEQLILEKVPVTDAGLQEISRLRGLSELAITGALVTDDGLACLTRLAKLDTLLIELDTGTFSQRATDTVAGMKSLRHVGLRPVASVVDLPQEMPGDAP